VGARVGARLSSERLTQAYPALIVDVAIGLIAKNVTELA